MREWNQEMDDVVFVIVDVDRIGQGRPILSV